MNLLFSNHVKIANKWLVLLSGFNKNAVDKNGDKVYEYKNFNIPRSWRETRWTKTMIKQILAYLGLSNSQGVLDVIDLEELASLLNCSVRSLKNNNKTLSDLGLIEIKELYGDLVHIKLIDYLHNFLDLETGNQKSTGYTRIKKEALFDMFQIKNINVLRIACRALYLHEKEVNSGGTSTVLLDSRTLKGFLPTYFSYKPVIKRSLRKIERLFDIQFFSVKEDKENLLQRHKSTSNFIEKLNAPYIISMKLKPNKDSRLVAEMENNIFVDDLISRELFEEIGAGPVDVKSLGELVHEFGRKVVEQAHQDILAYHKKEYLNTSEASLDCFQEINKLKGNFEPVGLLRKIFKKYALYHQEGYLFQS